MNGNIRNISLVALACALATPAFAQSNPADDEDKGIADIIVTATKRSESINKVPMSISAASGDQLAKAGVTDISGLAKIVPGFAAIDSSYGTPVYFLRGIGFYEQSLIAKSPVGVYVDEVPFSYPVMTSGVAFDLERVEVLKGPQGTLFGANATGGAINYIAAKPTADFQAGMNASYGRFGAATVGGFVSGPLSSTLSARLSVNHESRGDWQASVTRPDDTIGSRNFTQARAQLMWEPTDTLRVHATLNGFLDRSDTQQAQFIAPFAATPTTVLNPALATYPIGDSPREADWDHAWPLNRDNKMIQAALRADYDLTGDITLSSISAYSYYKQRQGVDADGTTLRINGIQARGHINSYNQELRLAGTSASLRWLIGANYEHSKAFDETITKPEDNSSAGAFLALGFPRIDLSPFYADTKFESKAVFGNIDYDLGDALTLHGGIRYTKTTNDFAGCLVQDGNNVLARGLQRLLSLPASQIAIGQCSTVVRVNGVPQLGEVKRSLPEDNVSWRLGLDFKPAEGQLIYANVSRGFKSGGFTNISGTDESQYMAAKQEQVTAYEVGVKSSLLDRMLQVNAAVFYYDYKDKQLRGRVDVPIFRFLEALINIPKSRVKGAELQIVAQPVTGLRLTGGGAYIDSKITSNYSNFTQFGQLANFKGEPFPYTPKWQLNGDVAYTFPLSDRLSGFIGGNLTYRSSTSGDFKPDPRVAVDGYTLLDLRAGLEHPDGKWRVTLWGRNVTNKYYWVTATRRSDTIVRFTGMPATYGVDVTVRF